MVRKLPWTSVIAGMATSGALLLAQAQPPATPANPNEERTQIERGQDQDRAQDQAEQNRERTRAEQDRARSQAEQDANRERERSQDATDTARRGQDRAGRTAETQPRGQFGAESQRDQIGQPPQRPGERAGQTDRGRDIPGRADRQRVQPGDRQQQFGQQQRFDQEFGRQRGQQQFGQQGQRRDSRGAQQGDLGLSFESTEQGQLTVSNIQQGTPAAQIGLREGDRIVSVDGRTFRSGEELNQFLITQRTGRVPIVVERDGQRQTVFWTSQQFGQLPPPGQFGPPHAGPHGMTEMRGQMGTRAALGLHLDPNAPGVVVRDVVPQGPAAEAGIRPGDQIVSLNGRDVQHFTQFTDMAAQLPVEQPATLDIARQGGQVQPVQVRPEPWHMVFQDSGVQQFGQSWSQPQLQQGWTQQQFAGPIPGQQWIQPQQQFGARGQMGFEQRGQSEMRQPYGVARPPLEGMQSGQVQQEIDELHREVDSLREQVQSLRQQIDSGRAGPANRQGGAPPRPQRPQPPEGAQPGI